MNSAVKPRPSHYEVLGLTPGASSDEIAQAFAKALSDLRPRPFGSLAEVTVAYEILRDPSKREAYDISVGLKPKPTPLSPPPPVVAPEWASFAMRASAKPAPRPASDPLPGPAPKADAPPRPEPIDEPKISPFLAAASPGEPSNADFQAVRPKPNAPAEPLRRPEEAPRPRLELPVGGELHFDESRRFQFDSVDLSQWKVPALAAGTLILAVGLGAWTGLKSGNDIEQAQTENSVTLKVPAAKPLPELAGSPLALIPAEPEARPDRQMRAAATRAERPRPPLQIDLPEESTGETQLSQGPQGETETSQAVAESLPVQATAPKLPLPNAVIARTIGRIGYPCGQVAATTAMEGGARGVFKVTCTSGHSYRASPVRGRYRFRQLASR